MAVVIGVSAPHTPPPPAARALAVFDLDRTLIPGSSLSAVGRELVRRGLLRRVELARFAMSEASFRRGALPDSSIERICSSLLTLAAGRAYAELVDVAVDLAPAIAASVYPGARLLVDHHRRAGDSVIVLSASPAELVQAVADHLGADLAVGTQVEVSAGVLTGRLASAFCYGAGKITRLRETIDTTDGVGMTAYADSGSDLPLLRAATRPVAVNPDRRLWAAADSARWPILRFS